MDNLSTHWTKDIHAWAANENVELVPTPTYASYLNRIECHFAAVSEFVVKNADHPDWPTLQKALADHGLRRSSLLLSSGHLVSSVSGSASGTLPPTLAHISRSRSPLDFH
jgi:hypothetical protein